MTFSEFKEHAAPKYIFDYVFLIYIIAKSLMEMKREKQSKSFKWGKYLIIEMKRKLA